MNLTIINDCRDENAKGRQVTRAISLFKCPVSFIRVENDLEAAGNLIDTLDALEENAGVVLVNVAPRNGSGKKWPNGSPFGYFWYKKILVVSSVDGLTLSLIKKFKLCKKIIVLDTRKTLEKFAKEKVIPEELVDYIAKSQFRSYDFLPRVGTYLAKGKKLAGEKLSIEGIPNAPKAIWWIDNFGNFKTTLLSEDLNPPLSRFNLDNGIETKFGKLPYYNRLKEVPDRKVAIITGSSGLGEKRFLEIVVQDVNGSARNKFNASVGDSIFNSPDRKVLGR